MLCDASLERKVRFNPRMNDTVENTSEGRYPTMSLMRDMGGTSVSARHGC